MAVRWRLSVWVLVGLALAVVALWDDATVSAVADRVAERTETIGRVDGGHGTVDDPGPSELGLSELDGAAYIESGAGNLLRPTTTTTSPPTTTATTATPTTTPTTSGSTPRGADDPTESNGTSPTVFGGPTTAGGDADGAPPDTTWYEEFAAGPLDPGAWRIHDSDGHQEGVVLRPSAVSVTPEPEAAGGHALVITAQPGSGDAAGELITGGLSLLGYGMTDGRLTFRARVDAGADDTMQGFVRLQPSGGERLASGPIDIAVGGSGWQTYVVERATRRITLSVDGGLPMELVDDSALEAAGPLGVSIHLDPATPSPEPDRMPAPQGEVRLMIDWIRIQSNNTPGFVALRPTNGS